MLKKLSLSILSMLIAFGGVSFALADSVSSDSNASINPSSAIYDPNPFLKKPDTNSKRAGNIETSASLNSSDQKDKLNPDGSASANNITQIKARADKEIASRIDDLNKLQGRVNVMKHLTDSQRANITNNINASIADMNNLKSKIDADTDITALKTDVQSITAGYRIYLLVLPQVRIWAAADRVSTITDMMVTVGAKFQVRITAAGTAGHDVTALQASLNDYNAKVTDAKLQAQAAESLIVNLTPDNGDQAKAAANKAALESAKAKLKLATSDLEVARKDAQSIIQGLRAFGDIHTPVPSTTGVKE